MLRTTFLCSILFFAFLNPANSQDCDSVDDDFDGVCSPVSNATLTPGETIEIEWVFNKAWNRDKVDVIFTWDETNPTDSSTERDLTDTVTVKEDWMWAETPTNATWQIPCYAVGSLRMEVITYNKWFFGAFYASMEEYPMIYDLDPALYAYSNGYVFYGHDDVITLGGGNAYPDRKLLWYEGDTAREDKYLGEGKSFEVSIDKPGHYIFTSKLDLGEGNPCGAVNSYPGTHVVTVIDSLPLLMERYYVTPDASNTGNLGCQEPSSVYVLTQTVEDFLPTLNQWLERANPDAPNEVLVFEPWFSTNYIQWSPQDYVYYQGPGTGLKACSYWLDYWGQIEAEYLQRNKFRTVVEYQVQDSNPFYNGEYKASPDVSTRWVSVYYDGNNMALPNEALVRANPVMLDLDPGVKGMVLGADVSKEEYIHLGPQKYTGSTEDWEFTWEDTPGLEQLNSVDARVYLDSVLFLEFGGTAKTFNASYTHIPSGISGQWQTRLIIGEYREERKPENAPKKEWKSKVYPNPGNHEVFVDFPPETEQIFIYNSQGHIVHEESATGKFYSSIQTGHLPAGLYIVQIMDSNGGAEEVKWLKSE